MSAQKPGTFHCFACGGDYPNSDDEERVFQEAEKLWGLTREEVEASERGDSDVATTVCGLCFKILTEAHPPELIMAGTPIPPTARLRIHCPNCFHVLAGFADLPILMLPHEGDAMLCVGCNRMGIWGPMLPRACTPEEEAMLRAEMPPQVKKDAEAMRRRHSATLN